MIICDVPCVTLHHSFVTSKLNVNLNVNSFYDFPL